MNKHLEAWHVNGENIERWRREAMNPKAEAPNNYWRCVAFVLTDALSSTAPSRLSAWPSRWRRSSWAWLRSRGSTLSPWTSSSASALRSGASRFYRLSPARGRGETMLVFLGTITVIGALLAGLLYGLGYTTVALATGTIAALSLFHIGLEITIGGHDGVPKDGTGATRPRV